MPQYGNLFQTDPNVIVKVKQLDEDVNNSNVLQNDDELFLAIGANEIWFLQLNVLYLSVGGTPSLKGALTYPAGASGAKTVMGDGATPYNSALVTQVVCGTFSSLRQATWDVIIINGATPGTVRFQWAQNVATAENTTVKANSVMIARKLN